MSREMREKCGFECYPVKSEHSNEIVQKIRILLSEEVVLSLVKGKEISAYDVAGNNYYISTTSNSILISQEEYIHLRGHQTNDGESVYYYKFARSNESG